MGDHLTISGGLLQAPLNPLKTDVSQGLSGLSGGQGPLGPTVIRPLVGSRHSGVDCYCGCRAYIHSTSSVEDLSP